MKGENYISPFSNVEEKSLDLQLVLASPLFDQTPISIIQSVNVIKEQDDNEEDNVPWSGNLGEDIKRP